MSRILSSEALSFIRFGQGALPSHSVFGDQPFSLFEWDSPRHETTGSLIIEITDDDIYNLTHARFAGISYFVDCLNQTRIPYSKELAELLPEGHPFRAAHGISDSKDSRANWLSSDPDLADDEKNLVREIYFQTDNLNRARRWRELVTSVNKSTFAWGDWRQAFKLCQQNSVEDAMDSLHPREAGVFRSLAAGMTISEIAERFGVSENRIKSIHKLAFDNLQTKLAIERNLVASSLRQANAASLYELAGLIRELTVFPLDFPQSRVLALVTKGKLVQSSAGESIVLWPAK